MQIFLLGSRYDFKILCQFSKVKNGGTTYNNFHEKLKTQLVNLHHHHRILFFSIKVSLNIFIAFETDIRCRETSMDSHPAKSD